MLEESSFDAEVPRDRSEAAGQLWLHSKAGCNGPPRARWCHLNKLEFQNLPTTLPFPGQQELWSVETEMCDPATPSLKQHILYFSEGGIASKAFLAASNPSGVWTNPEGRESAQSRNSPMGTTLHVASVSTGLAILGTSSGLTIDYLTC